MPVRTGQANPWFQQKTKLLLLLQYKMRVERPGEK